MKIIVKEQALEQLAKAAEWYEQRENDLGISFVGEWEKVVEIISKNPKSFPKKYKSFRQALLKRFPYVVMYKEYQETSVIYAVIHTSRHPKNRYKNRKK